MGLVQAEAPPPTRRRRRIGDRIDSSLRYGGPRFSEASDLPLVTDEGLIRSGRFIVLLPAAVRRPRQLAGLVVLLVRTRSEDVFLSRSLAGQALRAYFDQRSFGVLPMNRLCRGVLLLPRCHSEYLRGRSRQALRTNLRRAATAGIRCETVSDRSRALAELVELESHRAGSALTEEYSKDLRALVACPELELVVAYDRGGSPLAMAGVVSDDTVCLIWFAVAVSHDARWALHDHLVRTLIARGTRVLLAKGGGPFGALGFSENVQHYQHLLGYELRHLRLAPAHPVTRRRVATGALLAGAAAATVALPGRRSAVTGRRR